MTHVTWGKVQETRDKGWLYVSRPRCRLATATGLNRSSTMEDQDLREIAVFVRLMGRQIWDLYF